MGKLELDEVGAAKDELERLLVIERVQVGLYLSTAQF